MSRALPDGSAGIWGVGRVTGSRLRKYRRFYLSPRTVATLTEYLTDRGDDGSPALFADKNGRLTSPAILRMMRRWCDLIGIERVRPHQLREYFAWTFACRGGHPTDLCRLLGVVDRSGMKNLCQESDFPQGLSA